MLGGSGLADLTFACEKKMDKGGAKDDAIGVASMVRAANAEGSKMREGTRFSLAFYHAAGGGRVAVGIERRIKVAGGSKVEGSEIVRVLPDADCARTWVAEWNRREADRIKAEGLSTTHAE